MLVRRVLSKKTNAAVVISPAMALPRRILSKKISTPLAVPASQPRRTLSKTKVPPPPGPGVYVTKAMEAFESIRHYYAERGLPIPSSDITWYQQELIQEKKDYDEFWARCSVTKACIDGTLRGDDDWTITLAMNAAKQQEKKLPILESDIGPMPAYRTGEFWAWCHKRKQLKLQKEAAIIAAGGTIPPTKPKKPRAKKQVT